MAEIPVARIKRKYFKLTDKQQQELRQLANPEHVWEFWRSIAREFSIDYQTIVGTELSMAFSALPKGCSRPWCWPIYPVMCKKLPSAIPMAHT